jgi:membrane protein DedA with SNARE-associated domain
MQTTDVKEDQASPTESTPVYANPLAWAAVAVGIVIALRLIPYEPVQDNINIVSWITEHALDITKELFEHYGYPTVFFAPMLENTIFLGAIIPGTIVMLLAGLSAHDELINIWYAFPLAIAGAWIGDTVSYGIGRFGWQRLGPESRVVKWAEEMREPILKHTTWIVLVYHFAGYSRIIGPAASGFFRVPFGRWIMLDYAGSALWAVSFITGGYLLGVFGLSLDSTDRNVQIVEFLLFGFAALTIGTILYRARTSKREGPVNL